jgi:type IV secretory pathway TraG/TraD family ATPase VirD4
MAVVKRNYLRKLLTSPHSAAVCDIKGELHRLTAGYRSAFCPVYVRDPIGICHQAEEANAKQSREEDVD